VIEIQVSHDPGVVDERIERRKFRKHAVVQRRYRARIAYIALKGVDAGECSLGRIELFLVSASNDYRVTALVKLLRQFKADAVQSVEEARRQSRIQVA
jgi:hypothetical protein